MNPVLSWLLLAAASLTLYLLLRGAVRAADRNVRRHYAAALSRYDDRFDVFACDDHPACRTIRGASE